MLYEVITSHKKLEPEQATYIKIFTKQLHSLRIPFEGEMTGGLQLMGFLETRNLDFANIIILSVNEGQLPLNQVRTSFIPYSLRKGVITSYSIHYTKLYDLAFHLLKHREEW